MPQRLNFNMKAVDHESLRSSKLHLHLRWNMESLMLVPDLQCSTLTTRVQTASTGLLQLVSHSCPLLSVILGQRCAEASSS